MDGHLPSAQGPAAEIHPRVEARPRCQRFAAHTAPCCVRKAGEPSARGSAGICTSWLWLACQVLASTWERVDTQTVVLREVDSCMWLSAGALERGQDSGPGPSLPAHIRTPIPEVGGLLLCRVKSRCYLVPFLGWGRIPKCFRDLDSPVLAWSSCQPRRLLPSRHRWRLQALLPARGSEHWQRVPWEDGD